MLYLILLGVPFAFLCLAPFEEKGRGWSYLIVLVCSVVAVVVGAAPIGEFLNSTFGDVHRPIPYVITSLPFAFILGPMIFARDKSKSQVDRQPKEESGD